MVLTGIAGLVALFCRRYYFQTLISDTIYGLTAGFERGPYGIDQGAADSPLFSQIYQTPFLDALQSRMEAVFLAGFMICAFADNHYVGWIVPSGMAGFFSPLPIISTLLWISCMVVKPSSVRLRAVNGGLEGAVDVGALVTMDHISGVSTVVPPSAVRPNEVARILGVHFSWDGSFGPSSDIAHGVISYHLHCCTARNVCLLFLEVVLRAYVYARSQYGAAFQVLEWVDIAQLAKWVERAQRLRLGFPNWAAIGVALLPYEQGGLNLSMLHLEGFVIPWIRAVIHLLTLENTLGEATRQYVTVPDSARLQTGGARLRLEVVMKRLAPYGILFLSNRQQMACRAIANVQASLAAVTRSVRPLTELHKCPQEGLEELHSIFVLGGPLYCVIVHLMPDIKVVLDRMRPTDLCTTIARELQELLTRKAPSSPGYTQLGNHWDLAEWLEMGYALVRARWESDLDIALQRQASGLPRTDGRQWPDWLTNEYPVVAMLDDSDPPSAVVAELETGHSFLVATDGSASPEEHGKPPRAAWALVVYAVHGGDLAGLREIFAMAAPFPVTIGRTDTTSAETELAAALAMLRVMGRGALAQTHTCVDSQGTLLGLQRLISSEVPGVIDPTPREIRSWRCSPLWQRVVRLVRRLSSGRVKWEDPQLADGNSMQPVVRTWPTHNQAGVCVSKLYDHHISRGTYSWIRSHQEGLDTGPVPEAVAANCRADKLATEAAKVALIKPPVVGLKAGVVRIAAGTFPVRILYRGDAMDGDVGDIVRGLCARALLSDMSAPTPGRARSTTRRVIERRWGALASPNTFSDARVRGMPADIRESMFATQLGHYGRVEQQDDGRCRLCDCASTKYSTSHALASCPHPPLIKLRTAMLVAVNKLLSDSKIKLPTARVPAPGEDRTPTVIDVVVAPSLKALAHAGGFLLDGDIDALRGVPLASMAEWLRRTGLDGNGNKVPTASVVRVLKDITALIVVDGQHLLNEYKAAVEALRLAQEP
jgi:hypothetical protein